MKSAILPAPWRNQERVHKLWIRIEPAVFVGAKERAYELGFSTVADYVRHILIQDLLEGAQLGETGR